MANDKVNLNIDKDTLADLFQIAGLNMPEFVSEKEVKSAIAMLKLQNEEQGGAASPIASAEPTPDNNIGGVYKTADAPTTLVEPQTKFVSPRKNIHEAVKTKDKSIIRPRSVLVVDDLGIIIFQLNLLFKRLNFDVVTSQDTSDAIEKFKAKDFGYAILDLYIPTEREGFYLLDEIKKISLLAKLNTKIIVMSATSRESYKVKAVQHGADVFIEKTQGWQKNIIDCCVE